jgi:pimeloyl-ACP methyl ester carboxylesterase
MSVPAFFRRFLLWLTVAILALGLSLAGYERLAEWNFLRHHPPPGKLIDVGGYKLHLDCSGAGEPVVVLISGLGDASLIWHDIQPPVAQFARVCSYDRAGLGWSDSSPLPENPLSMTDELHALLLGAAITRPVVLVGHSMGGDLARLYASRFKDEVTGVLLVEASNEDKWTRIDGLVEEWNGFLKNCRRDEWEARFGLLRIRHPQMDYYPSAIRATADTMSYSPKWVAANCAEMQSIIGDGPGQIAQAQSLGSVPLIVLAAGKNIFSGNPSLPDPERAGKIWRQFQQEETQFSSHSEIVIAPHAGHDLHHDQPDLVISELRKLLSEISSSAR